MISRKGAREDRGLLRKGVTTLSSSRSPTKMLPGCGPGGLQFGFYEKWSFLGALRIQSSVVETLDVA